MWTQIQREVFADDWAEEKERMERKCMVSRCGEEKAEGDLYCAWHREEIEANREEESEMERARR